jgi:hypothetical protein
MGGEEYTETCVSAPTMTLSSSIIPANRCEMILSSHKRNRLSSYCYSQGTKMVFAGIESPQQRLDLITYLKTGTA